MRSDWKFDHLSFGIGMVSVAVLFAVLGGVVLIPKLQAIDTTWKTAFGKVVIQRDACQAQFREVTVLYDFAPMQGLQVGPVSVQPQMGGELLGGVRARWYIPAKIHPSVYGELQNARYFYYNPGTQKTQGPFVPAISK